MPRTTRTTRLSAGQLLASLEEFADLLVDAVDGGASVGFLAPLDRDVAAAWWRSLAPAVDKGRLVLLAARDGDRLAGTVSLGLEQKPNGRHRAEVTKLLVHRTARGRGLGRELLAVAEGTAADAGATLLLLDTETGSPAEYLYRSAGWTPACVIPDHAADPGGTLRPTTFFYKALKQAAP